MLSYLTLLLAAAIWGFAFAAQRKGLEYLDPFSFNALRFALGAAFIWLIRIATSGKDPEHYKVGRASGLDGQIILLGGLLFIAASLQQVGMLWVSAGNAGFITGLYIVFVPVIGLGRGQRLKILMLPVIVLAVLGLWLLNLGAAPELTKGSLIVLLGAVFWAMHVQQVDKLAKTRPALDLALGQYLICAILSLAAIPVYQVFNPPASEFHLPNAVFAAVIPLLYAGIMSVGVAFTLQIQAQKKVSPHVASVILCAESVFALLGGAWLLREEISAIRLLGSAVLLAAMLLCVLVERIHRILLDKIGVSEK